MLMIFSVENELRFRVWRLKSNSFSANVYNFVTKRF